VVEDESFDRGRDRSQPNAGRQQLMAACSLATETELSNAIDSCSEAADAVDVRPPETGLVMIRGRVGGDGAAFNAGEVTVTRAAVRLATGTHGFSYMLGRSTERARQSAIIDAVGQLSAAHMERLHKEFVAPVTKRTEAAKQAQRAETAATQVDFFTLVRGDE